MKIPTRIVIVGGTHGNEWTGIKIVEHYQTYLKEKFPSLNLEFIFANPEAHKLNRRFKDEDLNRAFEFVSENRDTYENIRAKEIKQLIDSSPCLVIDLHTTTANMGKTVIVSQYNSLNLSLCSHLAQQFSDCRIIGAPDPGKKYLASQSDFGLILEIGPVANSVVAGAPLESTLGLIESILMVISAPHFLNKGAVELFEEAQDIYYPQNEKGELNGYIHSGFQGQDFEEIAGDYTPFMSFQGTEIKLKTEESFYPIFINEAAYYPQKLAFTLCRKKTVKF